MFTEFVGGVGRAESDSRNGVLNGNVGRVVGASDRLGAKMRGRRVSRVRRERRDGCGENQGERERMRPSRL